MLRKSSIFASLGVGLMLLAARTGLADTITVHSLTENPTTGVFTYTVELDTDADVVAGDGFVIYDFPGLVSATLSGGGLTMSEFTLSQSLTSDGLNQSSGVNGAAQAAATPNGIAVYDNPTIENLTFAYNGTSALVGEHIGTLTLTSSVVGGTPTDSLYASIDNSGPTPKIPFSIQSNAVEVPSSAPAPAAAVGGMSLMGLIALARIKKALRMA